MASCIPVEDSTTSSSDSEGSLYEDIIEEGGFQEMILIPKKDVSTVANKAK